MRIYIGNKEIAGYFTRLKDGFDKIEVKSDLWFLTGNKYYNKDIHPLLKLNQKLFSYFKKNKTTKKFPLVIPVVFLLFLIHSAIFIYALFRYDVFILNSEPFFNFQEIRILKLFRKKIIFVFLGTEARPAYISGNNIQGKYATDDTYNLKKCFKETKSQIKLISLIEKYADHIINHPPTALFHKKPFIAWLHIGFPNDTPSLNTDQNNNKSRIVKVLHAPSNSVSKGSDKIMEIITRLRNDGLPVEFLKLENVPNEKVLEELKKCDFVIDEMYSDIPIGGLGTEAAFAGKAVINGGYYADKISHDYPECSIPPSCFTSPENLEHHIREHILNKPFRIEQAKKLQKFVTEKWDSASIAKKYMKIIQGSIPPEWLYDPFQIEYFTGYGIHNNKLQLFLNQYISKFGTAALFLDDKPLLKYRILSFTKCQKV